MQTTPKVIAVPDNTSNELGSIVWWHLTGSCDVTKLEAAWASEGLDPKYLLAMPSTATALRRAAKGQQDRRYLARPLKSGGWALVSEKAQENDLDYQVDLRISLDALGRLEAAPPDHPDVKRIRADYQDALDHLSTGDVSGWLCRLATGLLSGIPLRETGGFYFLPPLRRRMWEAIVKAVGVVSSHSLYSIPAMRTEGAVDAVLAAVSSEIDATVASVLDGIENIGPRGARTRIKTADAAVEKVGVYEEILGRSLDDIRERLNNAKAAAMRVSIAGEDA